MPLVLKRQCDRTLGDNWNGTPNIGNRVVVLDGGGAIVGRLGAAHEGEAPDQFLMPHGIAVDGHGAASRGP